jgi:hypothetical protein
VTDLDSADVIQRRATVDTRRSGPDAWVSPSTSSLSIDFTLYNPTLAVFASVRLFTYFPSSGAALPQVVVRTASLFGTRFQPSVQFEVVVACLLFAQLVQIVHASGLRLKWFKNAWNVFELFTWLIFLAVLIYDCVNLSAARALHIDLTDSAHFYDTWAVSGAIRGEVDMISALLYTLVIRALRYARLVPGWGPVLMAILSTIMDRAVLMYVGVLLVMLLSKYRSALCLHVRLFLRKPPFCACAVIAVSQFVAFSADSAYFSSLSVTFNNLFAMSEF